MTDTKHDDDLPEFEMPSAQDAARFTTFRAALMANFGVTGDSADWLAFEMSEKHPSLQPGDLTQALVDSFLVEELKKLRRDRERIDVSQLSEEDRKRKQIDDEKFDAELRALIRAQN
jgi:hypothetical protein